MTNRPSWLPQEAMILYDVQDQMGFRLIDKTREKQRTIGRFVDLEVANKFAAVRDPHKRSSTYVHNLWGVVVDGTGYLLANQDAKAITPSARAAVIAAMSEEERQTLKLVDPHVADPVSFDKKLMTLYDLTINNPVSNWDLCIGRFLDRKEAEKFVELGKYAKFQIEENLCFVSGARSHKLLPLRLTVMTSVKEALLEQLAPEYRALLDV